MGALGTGGVREGGGMDGGGEGGLPGDSSSNRFSETGGAVWRSVLKDRLKEGPGSRYG